MSGHRRSGPTRRVVPLHGTSLLGVVSIACLTVERDRGLPARVQSRTSP
jgi:hypothetical protein